jgi:hypothetical protein
MIIKSIEDIRTELTTQYNELIPQLDLTEGTPERDIFIEAQIAGNLQTIWDGLEYTQKLHAPLVYYEDLDEDDIDNYCSTFNVIQTPATYSTGEVTFYTTSEPTEDIEIADGTVISTVSTTPIEFETIGNYTIYEATKDAYYNATTERWEITCSVQAINSGAQYRATSGAVTKIVSSVNNIEGVTNESAISGGEEAESIINRLQRVSDVFQGRDLGPTAGIRSFISVYTRDINIVGANDPLMERDETLGGAIDIYVIGEELTTATDEVTIAQSGLDLGVNVNYTSTGITLTNQPVNSITNFLKNGSVVSPDYYTLEADTGVLKKSTQGLDKLSLTEEGLANIGSFAAGDALRITYLYNSFLTTIETDLNSTANHFQNRDYLLREMNAVTVDVSLRFKEVDGQDFNTVSAGAQDAAVAFIDSIKTAGTVELADVVGVVKNYTGVDNIDLTTATITPSGGGTLTAQGDIVLDKNEYPVAGTTTFTRWTN